MRTTSTTILAGIALLALVGVPPTTAGGPPPEDFGDAPDPTYPTVLPGGARHVAIGPILGTFRDIEADGQPNFPATGDDMALLPDDEDGVFLTSPLVPGSTASATVIASGTGPYVLNAWIDFNDDGDWADPGEQIFTDTVLVAGTNLLTFPVPAGPAIGRIYSRWRLNTTGGLSYIGPAADGEVEDYCHAPIHGQKWHDLNGDGKRNLATEPGLNGQVIQLYDETGTTLIASATTHDFDHDGTPGINPITERGVYWMHAPSGFCRLRETANPNQSQTFPANCGANEYFIWVQCEEQGRTPPDNPPLCGNVIDWVENCAAGIDEMFSAAILILQTPPAPPFNGEQLILFANGPTFVNRSAPLNPGPGSAFIQTEMLEMDLVGHHPAIGRFHAQAGSNFGLPPSQGEITEFGSTNDFLVESFFDVFFEISVPEFGQAFRNDFGGPGAHVETQITEVPPVGEEYVEENIPLFDHPAGTPSGFTIIKLIHKPIYGFDFANKITNAQKKADLRKKCNRLKKQARKAKRKGQRSKARRLNRMFRKCKRELNRL